MKPNLKVDIDKAKLADNRNDSFWYKGDIAHVNLVSGNRIYAEATGEIRVSFDEDTTLKGIQAVEYARDKNLTDDDLDQLGIEDCIHNSNWFSIIKTNAKGDVIDDDIAIYHTYDEVMEVILEIAHNIHNEEYS